MGWVRVVGERQGRKEGREGGKKGGREGWWYYLDVIARIMVATGEVQAYVLAIIKTTVGAPGYPFVAAREGGREGGREGQLLGSTFSRRKEG